jgi:hypothetical protein
VDDQQYSNEYDDDDRMAACSYCKTAMKMANLSACAGCQCVLYCSLECQRNHWPKHGLECASLAANGGGPQFEMDLEDDDSSFDGDDDEAHETESICDNCESEDPEDLWLMCGKCHKVVYCCAECQNEGWEEHQKVCDDLAKGRDPKKSKKSKKKSSKSKKEKSKRSSGHDDGKSLSQSKHKSKSSRSRSSSKKSKKSSSKKKK